MDTEITRLDWLLSQIQLLDPPYQESEEGKRLYQEICKLLFQDQLYVRIWSEPILNHLDQLLQTEKPAEELFAAELEEICKRTIAVREVNDIFFGIVDPNTTSKELCQLLARLECLPENFSDRLDTSGRLQEIRNQDRYGFEFINGVKSRLWYLVASAGHKKHLRICAIEQT